MSETIAEPDTTTEIAGRAKNVLLCCPFCGEHDLTENLWSLDEGEVDALECNNCYAGAPVTSWNKRHATSQPV